MSTSIKTSLDKARDKYEKKRRKKFVSFNTENEADLLQYADQIPDFSSWVKEHLKDAKEKSGAPN